MPAKTKHGTSGKPDIPGTILRSEKHAQHIWKKAHDSAVDTYGEGGRAHRVAYAALKHEYEKRGDKWVKKAHPGPFDPQAARGPTTKRKSTDTAGDLMSAPITTAGKDAGFVEVLRLMRHHKVRRMPVVTDAGTLYGIVTADDIIKLLATELSLMAGAIREQPVREGRLRK